MHRNSIALALAVCLTVSACSGGEDPGSSDTTSTATSSTALPSGGSATSTGSGSPSPPASTTSSASPGSDSGKTRPLVAGPRITAAHLAKAPRIDGLDGDWPQVTAYQVSTKVSGTGAGAISSSWRLGWNSHTLFVFATVTDPNLTQTHLQRPWLIGTGDAIGLEVGTFTTKVATDRMGARDVRILIAPTETGATLRAVARAQGPGFATGQVWTSGAAQTRRTSSGYDVEAAIPWSTLRVEQAGIGTKLAANLLLADAISSGAKRGALSAQLSNNPQRRGTGVKWRFAWGVLELTKDAETG